jgi:hypothetical protein
MFVCCCVRGYKTMLVGVFTSKIEYIGTWMVTVKEQALPQVPHAQILFEWVCVLPLHCSE